jgi:hypothetical protein
LPQRWETNVINQNVLTQRWETSVINRRYWLESEKRA